MPVIVLAAVILQQPAYAGESTQMNVLTEPTIVDSCVPFDPARKNHLPLCTFAVTIKIHWRLPQTLQSSR